MADRYDPAYRPQEHKGGQVPPRRGGMNSPHGPRPAGQGYRGPHSQASAGPGRRPSQAGSPRRQVPVPDAQAAQRAARSSLQAQASDEEFANYGDYGSYYANNQQTYQGYDDQNQDLPGSYAYLDDLIEDDSSPKAKLPTPAKIGIIAGVAIVGLLLLFVIVRAIFLHDDNDVRLQRQTTPKRGIVETTTKATQPTTTDLPTLPQDKETLPPLGTDPYDNAPAWTPPASTEADEKPTPPPVAPPPQVIDLPTDPPAQELPPAYLEPTPESEQDIIPYPSAEPSLPQFEQPSLPQLEEPSLPQTQQAPQPQIPVFTAAPTTFTGETSPPPRPTDANGQPVEPSGPETSPLPPEPTEPPTPLEELAIDLPDLAQPGQFNLPYTEMGSNITGQSANFAMWPDVNGQYNLANIEGNYAQLYSSSDNSYLVGQTPEGQYKLFSSSLPEGVDLPFASAQGLDKLVGNQGLAYMSSGQLYYLSYTDLQPRVIAANVSEALMAEEAGNFLVVSEAGVKLVDMGGQDLEQLLVPYSSQGNIKLDSYTQDGKLAIFEDDMTVYIYRPDVFGSDLARLPKSVPGSPSYVRRSQDGQEVLSYQVGSNGIIRVGADGSLDQVTNPNWALSEQSLILPVTSESGSTYGSLAVLDQGNLYLANAYVADDGQGGKQAAMVFQGVQEVFASGFGLYWTDKQGSFYAIDTRADLGSPDATAVEIANGDISHISSNEDGSAIFYLKNGSLWERRSGNVAFKLADNVASYISNPEGSKFYLITTGGGLQSLTGGVITDLAPSGSGVDASSLDLNPMASRSGNTWIATARIAWLANGQIYTE